MRLSDFLSVALTFSLTNESGSGALTCLWSQETAENGWKPSFVFATNSSLIEFSVFRTGLMAHVQIEREYEPSHLLPESQVKASENNRVEKAVMSKCSVESITSSTETSKLETVPVITNCIHNMTWFHSCWVSSGKAATPRSASKSGSQSMKMLIFWFVISTLTWDPQQQLENKS